jgi:rhamnulokinase
MPDLFHYFFTGIKVNEWTDASTSQLTEPFSRNWAYPMVRQLALPAKILGTIVAPGTVLGPLRASVAADSGLRPVPVVLPASHDTASAVVAVPARNGSWAYLSSGTWSLMGLELVRPCVSEQARAFNFTNEGGWRGTTRLLKNIMGLWLVQECRRNWEKQGHNYSYDELATLAQKAPPWMSLVDPDDPTFLLPACMTEALAAYCRRSGQAAPADPGAFVRCALESLALRYRWVLERLEELAGRAIEVIHVVGGGSQNQLLCQFTADACNRPVLAGPVEATAIGNVLVQGMGLGLLSSLEEAREIVRRSFEVRTYTPEAPGSWHGPYDRFLKLLGNSASA